MTNVRIYLSGRVGLEIDGEMVVREHQFRGQQDRLAFAYLVCERGRPATRDELAEALWPDARPDAWPSALSAIISRLRSLLAGASASISISRGFGQYRLSPPTESWVDIEAAAAAVDAAEAALRDGDPRRAFSPAVIASTIGRRPFFPGSESAWFRHERQKLHRARVRALECLASVWLATGDAALAIEAAAEAVSIEPFRESSHRLLMQAHRLAGNPAEAVKTYHRLRDLLVAELGTDPAAETETLYLELLR